MKIKVFTYHFLLSCLIINLENQSGHSFHHVPSSSFIRTPSHLIKHLTKKKSLANLNKINKIEFPSTSLASTSKEDVPKKSEKIAVAYRSLSISVDVFDTEVPVALWYPVDLSDVDRKKEIRAAEYKHSISVPRIGQLLASINFLPSFLKKDYNLNPTLNDDTIQKTSINVIDGSVFPIVPAEKYIPVLFFAHGYLGSRFDLSHLAEFLAQQGFVCISPEYPESLAASYERQENLDRSIITDQIRKTLFSANYNLFPMDATFRFGIIGHSLGCGTATKTGDKSWTRVCVAGFPGEREDTLGGNMLFISSINDGAVSLERLRSAIPSDFERMNEEDDRVKGLVAEYEHEQSASDDSSSASTKTAIPRRTAMIFERENGPNHISFLAGSVNDAMIDLLSPLLPIAQALNIPVLDFDKYSESRDSKQTADIMVPIVSAYLRQRMLN